MHELAESLATTNYYISQFGQPQTATIDKAVLSLLGIGPAVNELLGESTFERVGA